MATWQTFEQSAPPLAAAGKRLLYHPEHGEVGIFATLDAGGAPRLAPLCPIFTATGIYILVAATTPKRRHLDADPRYALHAQVGASDEEFQIRGLARPVHEADERTRVLDAVTYDSFERRDPIFELDVQHALWVTWEEPGAPVRHAWTAPSPAGTSRR